jgi:hypothetical protein
VEDAEEEAGADPEGEEDPEPAPQLGEVAPGDRELEAEQEGTGEGERPQDRVYGHDGRSAVREEEALSHAQR